MEKIVIFNPSDYRTLFLLAAIIKAGYTPTYAHNLGPLWEVEEIILLNINPNEKLEKLGLHPDLDLLLYRKSKDIKAWLNFPGELDANNPSVQNILRHFSPQMEIDSFVLGDETKWPKKPAVARYGQALHTAKVISSNKNHMTEYRELLVSAAYSLATGNANITIDSFQVQYQRVLDTTEYCFERISTKESFINLPGKEIAFGYLDTASNYLDMAALRKQCLRHYPFLTIIQYRQHGKEYNWFLSKKQLNIKIVFQLISTENNYEMLIECPHGKMREHLQKSIEGITKT
jgi:hypothetical protein